MRPGYIITAAANALSLLLFTLFTALSSSLAGSLTDQQAAKEWAAGETPCAQVSVFAEETSAYDINSIFTARVNIDKKLQENSLVSQREGARTWTDAFSTTQTKISVSTSRASADAKLIATGGDFFLFHPFEIISGYYYSDSDLMQDRVLIDDVLAWQLYGASDVAGMPVTINGKYFFIAGVYKQSENSYIEKVYGSSPRIFMSYEGYELMSGSAAAFTCYEAVMPNQVPGQAMQIVKEVLSITDESMGIRTVDNSARYSLKSRFGIIADGTRSVVDCPVVYPFWENAARITEDRSAGLLVAQAVCLLLPIGTVIYLLVKLYRNRKKLFKKFIDAVIRVFDKLKQKKRDKSGKRKRSAADPKTNPNLQLKM